MNIGIVGSRTFNDYKILKSTLNNLNNITTIVSGGAKGTDTLAEKFANEKGYELLVFKPEWNKYGKRAGFVRNNIIVDNSDTVIAFWDNKSKGTKNSIDLAINKNKNVIVYNYHTLTLNTLNTLNKFIYLKNNNLSFILVIEEDPFIVFNDDLFYLNSNCYLDLWSVFYN